MTARERTLITPARAWRLPDPRELWQFRELFLALGWRDVRVRYRQTLLGMAWAILQPLATMMLFTLIFGRLANVPSEGYPYPVFVYAGLLPWMLFSATVSTAAGSIVGSAGLVTRVWFPRIVIPPASVVAPLVDFAISTVVLLALMVIYGIPMSVRLLTLPFLAALVALFAASLGTALSAAVVTYRDIRFVVPFIVQLWLFASPVIYPSTLVPERWRWILEINPMTGILDGFRWALLGTALDPSAVLISIAATLLMALVALTYFQRVEDRFADVV